MRVLGLSNLAQPSVMIALVIGAIGGLVIGAIPGIGPAIAIANFIACNSIFG